MPEHGQQAGFGETGGEPAEGKPHRRAVFVRQQQLHHFVGAPPGQVVQRDAGGRLLAQQRAHQRQGVVGLTLRQGSQHRVHVVKQPRIRGRLDAELVVQLRKRNSRVVLGQPLPIHTAPARHHRPHVLLH